MKSICVFGLGWLGKQIVNSLLDRGFNVIGLNRSIKKELSISQWHYDINEENLKTIEQLRATKFDYLIITIPPSSSINYAEGIHKLLKLFNLNKTLVIYTSSTSIYGEEVREITEESSINPITRNANQIAQVEEIILHEYKKNGVILRLAGLVGKNRHPVFYLSGKSDIKKPHAPVNLVHAEEIIQVILNLLTNWRGGIYNVCNPDHPSRLNYYKKMAEYLELDEPMFKSGDKSLGKLVHSDKLKELNFGFKYKLLDEFPKPMSN